MRIRTLAHQRFMFRFLKRAVLMTALWALCALAQSATELYDPFDANGPLAAWTSSNSSTSLTAALDIPGVPNPSGSDSCFGLLRSNAGSGSTPIIYGEARLAESGAAWNTSEIALSFLFMDPVSHGYKLRISLLNDGVAVGTLTVVVWAGQWIEVEFPPTHDGWNAPADYNQLSAGVWHTIVIRKQSSLTEVWLDGIRLADSLPAFDAEFNGIGLHHQILFGTSPHQWSLETYVDAFHVKSLSTDADDWQLYE